jgi:TPR repeat protein
MSAELGNPNAMCNYAGCLKSGEGVGQDLLSAARYFKMAADVGHSIGMSQYATLLYFGRGVDIDFASAAGYYRRSADLGNPCAMHNYSACLTDGRGVEKDLSAAARYAKMAADLGFPMAMYSYACKLSSGEGTAKDAVAAGRYLRMAADSDDPVLVWRVATRLREGAGVPKDEDAAHRYFARLESSTNVERLSELVLVLRCGWDARMDIGESLRWCRRCAELGDVRSFEQLGLCYEKGIGVEVDLIEAARLYERASDLGSRPGQLSLGVFRWRGIGGFSVDREEAVRLWRLAGLDVPDTAVRPEEPGLNAPSDSSPQFDRLVSSTAVTEDTGVNRILRSSFATAPALGATRSDSTVRQPGSSGTTSADTRQQVAARFLSESTLSGNDWLRSENDAICSAYCMAAMERDSSALVQLDSLPEELGGTVESFALCNSGQVIESVVLSDGRPVREFLSEGPCVDEIARLAGEGIRREGRRCLEREFDGIDGEAICGEMIACDKVESLLQMPAQFYTLDRVNSFLLAGIGEECFCAGQKSSPLAWECPQVVDRGADFDIDVLVDYARRPEDSSGRN